MMNAVKEDWEPDWGGGLVSWQMKGPYQSQSHSHLPVKNLWVAPAGYLHVIECAESLFYHQLSASSLACSQDA